MIRCDGTVAKVNHAWRVSPRARSADTGAATATPEHFSRFLSGAVDDGDAVRAIVVAVESALSGRPEPVEIAHTNRGDAAAHAMVTRVCPFDAGGERWVLVTQSAMPELPSAPGGDSAHGRAYEELIQSIDGIVWELELATFDFTFVSDKSTKILGYPPEAWYEKGFWESKLHPADRDWAMTFCATATARKENHEFTYRIFAADGRAVWLHDVVTVIVENDQPVKLRGVMFDVTGEREAEARRQETEQSYRRLVELSPWPIAVHQDGAIVLCNDAAVRALGATSAAGVLGEPVARFVRPEERSIVAERAKRGLESGQAIASREYDIVRIDGTVFPGEVFVGPATHEGRPAVQLLIQDLTERRQAEQAVRESERMLRDTLENIDLVAVALDREGRVTFCNKRLLGVTGRTREQAQGADWFSTFLPGDITEEVRNVFTRLIDGQEPLLHNENEILTSQGERRHVRWSNSYLRDPSGRVTGTASIGEDVTEQREAIRALTEYLEQYHAILNSTTDGFWITDDHLRILDVNENYVRMSGWSREELLSMWIGDLEARETSDIVEEHGRRITVHGSDRFESAHRRKDGSVFEVEVSTSVKPNGRFVVFVRDITARKNAENALLESEQRLRTIVDNAPFGAHVIDLDASGTLVFVASNPEADRLLGISQQQLIGRPIETAFPALGDEALQALRGVAENGGHWEEDQIASADSPFAGIFEIHAVQIAPRRIASFFRDVSERRKAEESLREREALFEAIFQTNNAIKLLIDPASETLVDANTAAVDFYGYPIDQLRGMAVSAINTNPRARIVDDMAEASRRAKTYFEFRHRLSNGVIRDVEVYSGPIAMGGRTLLFSIVHDITERKTSESRLRQLAVALENVPDAIYITDATGTINYHNRALETITGYSTAELVGATPHLFRSGQHDATFYKRMWEVITTGRLWSGRVVNRRKDGSLFHEEKTIAPIHDAQGEPIGFVSVGRDVSEEIALEGRLREAQKMEAIGQLAGGLAHDLNNLLQGIFSYLDLASLDIREQAPNVMPDIEEVRRAAARAATITQQLLAFSRRQLLDLRSIHLNDLVSGFLRMIQRMIRENIELDFDPSPSQTIVRADASQLEQVILNLCLNARDAMPEGGHLRLSTFIEDFPHDSTRLSPDTPAGRYVAIRVSDTGIGMDDWTRRRIFEPFFSTKRPGQGSGLGLAMVYGIVRQHRGLVEVESAPGEGTTFTIYLPESQDEPSDASAALDETCQLGGSEMILFAEDSELIRSAVERVLRSNGYRVLTVADGVDAVAAFEANRSEISLVLLDVVMPRLSGKEASQRIHDIDPDVPVIFCSGYDPDTEQTRFVVEGGYELLRKPFDNVALLRRLRRAIDSRL